MWPRLVPVIALVAAACAPASPAPEATQAVAGAARPEAATVTLQAGPAPGASGTIVFHSDREGRHRLFTLNPASGAVTQLTEGTGHHDEEPAMSPDGASIAFVTTRFDSRTWDIGMIDARGGAPRRITSHLAVERHPAWAADGRSLLFASEQDGAQAVFRVSLDDGAVTRVSPAPNRALMPAVAPDGNRVAYTMGTPDGLRIVVQDLATGEWRAVTPAGQDAAEPAWSPDGARLAYARLWPGGESSIEVLTLATGAIEPLLVDAMFAVRAPAWSPDGEWIAAAGSAGAGWREDWDLVLLRPRAASAGYRLTSGPAHDHAPAWMRR